MFENDSGETLDHHHPQTQTKTDDDVFNSLRENRFEKLQDTAKNFLTGKGEDPEFVEVAIQRIDERSASLGKSPASPAYYIAAFETLKHSSEDTAEIWETVNRRHALREKYMANFTGKLSPEMEERRRMFIQEKTVKA